MMSPRYTCFSRFLLSCVVSFLLAAHTQAARLSDKEALARLDAFFPGDLINNPFNLKWQPQGADKAKIKGVSAPEIWGQSAFQVEVQRAQKHAWQVQLVAPVGSKIKRDEVILLAFWARAEQVNRVTGESKILVRLGRNVEPYDAEISEEVSLSEDWRLYYLKARSSVNMRSKALSVFFQMGNLKQTVEIGQFYVTSLGRDGDIDELPYGREDLSGNFEAFTPKQKIGL